MTKKPIIYFDNNASTACAPEVVEAMLPYFSVQYGNPSSSHWTGRQAFRAIEASREKIAELLSAKKHEFFFNSGATEGNNWIFNALAQAKDNRKKRIVVSAIEHRSVLDTALRLKNYGFDVEIIPVTVDGVVDLKKAAEFITKDTALVSVQFANNETGVIQPIAELLEIAHGVGAYFHCDAVQGAGKTQLDLSTLPIDSAVISAHKVHGPKGVGALFVRGGAKNWPWEYPTVGGGQEQNIRPGTLNVAGIVGFGKAAELMHKNLADYLNHMRTLQRLLEERLKSQIKYCIIHGEKSDRIPNTTYVVIPGIPADMLIANLPTICISNGSACNSGVVNSSHVLNAMAVDEELSENSVRISISRYSTVHEIEVFLNNLEKIMNIQ